LIDGCDFYFFNNCFLLLKRQLTITIQGSINCFVSQSLPCGVEIFWGLFGSKSCSGVAEVVRVDVFKTSGFEGGFKNVSNC
jgi:hypothetical protein